MKRLRLTVGLALMAGSIVWGSVATLQALPPGTAAAPGMVLSPALGDSSTEMTLALTSPDNVCPGDTATGNYRWNTFMAPSSVDVGTLTYNNQGPISPAGVTVRPLFSAIGGSSQVNKATAVQTGQIVGTSTVSFAVFAPGNIAPGSYKIGYACTKVPALGQPAQTERFWQTEIAVTASATGGPAQIAWTSGTVGTSTTTTVGGTTTTTTTVVTPPPPPPPPPTGLTQTIFATKAAAGSLIIQQRCGTFGAVPAVNDPDLGFLPSLPAVPAGPALSSLCGIDLGTTTLVNTGPRQGQFYGATGRINQIEVVDTRQGNQPWTVSVQFGQFNNGGTGSNDVFSSNLLGWQPQVTNALTPAGNTDGNVIPGPAFAPTTEPTPGLPRTLAAAFPGKTAGFVQLDARVRLLIPATANSGRFSASITFTVI